MCGIIGYAGSRRAIDILLDGLTRLEYRGYDSVGVAVVEKKKIFFEKLPGKISDLEQILRKKITSDGSVGIGHTRWATHGAPTVQNAHPHLSCKKDIFLVHNGIIENYLELRKKFLKKGHRFESQTDTEVIVHLIEQEYKGEPLKAISNVVKYLKGSFALAIMFQGHPDKIYAARLHSPLIVGLNTTENFIASDIPAVLPHTKDVYIVNDGEIIEVSRSEARVYSLDLEPRPLHKTTINLSYQQAQKRGYPHFMLKEIHEEPEIVQAEIAGRILGDKINLDELKIAASTLKKIDTIIISACGTAWHAALYAKYLLKELCKVTVDTWLSSEFRYSDYPFRKNSIVVGISQSGETADTLQAIRIARSKRVKTLAITNSPSSSITREADYSIYNRAGIEIGVAATKTYISQLVSLLIFGLYLAQVKGVLKRSFKNSLISSIKELPDQLKKILDDSSSIKVCAREHLREYDFMFIGRKYNVATAYEGALKMKEISYVHAEGYAAGEMKHGPLALVDTQLATVAIAVKDSVYDKMRSNIQEVKARGGKIIAVATEQDKEIAQVADTAFFVPKTYEMTSPILTILPLQLLAYYTAALLGRDVDHPRNLAKSVTVE